MADTKLDKQVRLSGALPGEDRENGLDRLAGALVDDPTGSMVLAVVVLDVKSVNHDIVSDVYVPLMRIREIEAVMRDEAPAHVVEWMLALRDQRRGEHDGGHEPRTQNEQQETGDGPVENLLIDDVPLQAQPRHGQVPQRDQEPEGRDRADRLSAGRGPQAPAGLR